MKVSPAYGWGSNGRKPTTLTQSPGFKTQAFSLSFEAHLAISYAALLASKGIGLKVSDAAVVRRAVCRYADYLSSLNPTQFSLELGSLKTAAKARNGTSWHQREVWERLATLEQAQQPPSQVIPFKELLLGKDYSPPISVDSLEARVDELLATHRSRPGRNKAPTATPTPPTESHQPKGNTTHASGQQTPTA